MPFSANLKDYIAPHIRRNREIHHWEILESTFFICKIYEGSGLLLLIYILIMLPISNNSMCTVYCSCISN